MKEFILLAATCCIHIVSHSQTRFIWPLKKMQAYSEVADCYVTNNYVDLNAASNAVLDWNCQTRTYDGHRGIDIDLWPFWWSMMDNNYVAVVAAAAGRVVSVSDGLTNENNCGRAPYANPTWNHIAIRHQDSSTTLYGHIRTNSATVVVGQLVNAGDIIAFVGSSGSSSNPHLHFEVNTQPVSDSQPMGFVEPFTGTCNTSGSLWLDQKPYQEPAIVRIMTHGSRPHLPGYYSDTNLCRIGEVINAKANFAPNDSIYFGIAVRDFLAGQSYAVSIYDPGGALWFSSNTTTSVDNRRNYYTIDTKIPANAVAGTYRFEANLNGTIVNHFFSVNCPSTQNVTGTIFGWKGYKSSGTLGCTAILPNGNRVLLQAASKITLSPGFSALNGSIMKARIRDCNYSE